MTMTSFDYEQINCTYSYQHFTIKILLANLYIYLQAFAAVRFIKKLQLKSVLHNQSPFSSKHSQDNMHSKVDVHTLTTWHLEA